MSNDDLWRNIDGVESYHYSTFSVTNGNGMRALRTMFPDAKADEMNFVLFSTSGVHGTYATIEEMENKAEDVVDVTFLVVHPRLVTMRYGLCQPETEDDFEFLKKLRQSSWDVVQTIGRSA